MHPLLKASAALFLSAPLLAQSNPVGYDVGATDFTSRSGLSAASPGDVLQRVDGSTLVGIGNTDGGRITGMTFVVQDQDLATRDPMNLVVYPDDGAGAPQLAGADRSSDFALPMGTAGPAAFFVTLSFATPLALPSTDYHFGVGLAAAPSWPSDGLSLHGCSYTQSGRVTNPRAPGITSSVDTGAGTLAATGLRRLHRIRLLTDSPVLEAGADVRGAGRQFGLRGYWSDRTALDGIAYRLRDARAGGSLYAVVGQISGANPSPVRVPGIDGLILLTPGLLFPSLLGTGTLDPDGYAEATPYPAPLVLPAPLGQISAQALIDPFSAPKASNLVVIQDS